MEYIKKNSLNYISNYYLNSFFKDYYDFYINNVKYQKQILFNTEFILYTVGIYEKYNIKKLNTELFNQWCTNKDEYLLLYMYKNNLQIQNIKNINYYLLINILIHTLIAKIELVKKRFNINENDFTEVKFLNFINYITKKSFLNE